MNGENVRLLAENARVRAEIDRVEQLLPRLVPYSGEAPRTVAEFEALPGPWRRQVVERWPGLAEDLINKARIQADLERHDRAEARRVEILKDVPFKTAEEFNNLPEAERQEWAGKLTGEQREALAGTERPDPDEGWL